MANVSRPIDLSQLPAPDAVEVIDYEQILAARKAGLVSRFSDDEKDAIRRALMLESEPLTASLQENSEREVTLRQRVNEACRAVFLATAHGSDLENLAAEYSVFRLTVQAADSTTNPPTAAVMEDDESLRERAQMAWEGLSTAGPRGAWIFHARSAHGQIADVSSISPAPCEILISVLSNQGDGTAPVEVLDAVRRALSDEDVRPLGDQLTVQSSRVQTYRVRAVLHLSGSGPGADVVTGESRRRCTAYVNRPRRQGQSIWRSALTAALHVEGVERLELTEPAADLILDPTEAGTCIEIVLTVADEDGQ